MYILINLDNHAQIMGDVITSVTQTFNVPVSVVHDIRHVCPDCSLKTHATARSCSALDAAKQALAPDAAKQTFDALRELMNPNLNVQSANAMKMKPVFTKAADLTNSILSTATPLQKHIDSLKLVLSSRPEPLPKDVSSSISVASVSPSLVITPEREPISLIDQQVKEMEVKTCSDAPDLSKTISSLSELLNETQSYSKLREEKINMDNIIESMKNPITDDIEMSDPANQSISGIDHALLGASFSSLFDDTTRISYGADSTSDQLNNSSSHRKPKFCIDPIPGVAKECALSSQGNLIYFIEHRAYRISHVIKGGFGLRCTFPRCKGFARIINGKAPTLVRECTIPHKIRHRARVTIDPKDTEPAYLKCLQAKLKEAAKE